MHNDTFGDRRELNRSNFEYVYFLHLHAFDCRSEGIFVNHLMYYKEKIMYLYIQMSNPSPPEVACYLTFLIFSLGLTTCVALFLDPH
jgi:hypothetical protein